MNRIVIYGAFMWGMVFGMALLMGFAMVGGSVSASDTVTGSQAPENATTIETDFFSMSVTDDYEIDIYVGTDDTEMEFENVSEEGVDEFEMENDNLGEEEAKHAQTGLCAVGLDNEDTPLFFGVDDDGTVSSDSMEEREETPTTPDEVLEECT